MHRLSCAVLVLVVVVLNSFFAMDESSNRQAVATSQYDSPATGSQSHVTSVVVDVVGVK